MPHVALVSTVRASIASPPLRNEQIIAVGKRATEEPVKAGGLRGAPGIKGAIRRWHSLNRSPELHSTPVYHGPASSSSSLFLS